MIQYGFAQLRAGREEDAVQSLELSRKAFRSIDNLALGDLPAAAGYTEASAWEVDTMQTLGRRGEAKGIGEEAIGVASQILEKRPGHMPALRSRALIASALSGTEDDDLHLAKALVYSQAAERDWQTFRGIDPGNAIGWNNLLATGAQTFGLYWRMGRIGDALAKGRSMVEPQPQGELPAMIAANIAFTARFLEILQTDTGNRKQAEATAAELRKLAARAIRELPEGSFDRTAGVARIEGTNVLRLLADDDPQDVRRASEERRQRVEALKPTDAGQERLRNILLLNTYRDLATAVYRLGEYDKAEPAIRKVFEYQRLAPPRTLYEEREASEDQVLLALCLARLGRAAEARQAIEPGLQFHRQLHARGDEDMTQRVQLALALYASAVAGGPKATAQLKEAASILDGLPPAMKALRTTTRLRGWIADEPKKA
jgi:tetratricopeptide (TPR) repeat protein